MAITQAQKAAADAQQWRAARDPALQVRVTAGPGAGKSYTIEKRIVHLLRNGANPRNVYVISFTRATGEELRSRIDKFCATQGLAALGAQVRVSTMHSLALR